MHLFLIFGLLCLQQLAAAQKHSHTEGLVNLSKVTSGERQLWKAVEDLGLREAFNDALHRRAMTPQRVDSGTALWRALGRPSDSSAKIQSFGRSKIKGAASSLESPPAWHRKLGVRDPHHFTNSEVFSEHVSGRDGENEEPGANTPPWPSTSRDTLSAYVYSAGGQEEAEERRKTCAAPAGEKENQPQEADDNSGMIVLMESRVSSERAQSEELSDQPDLLNTEGHQPRPNHSEPKTRGHIHGGAAHASGGASDADPGSAQTRGRDSGDNSAAGAGERFQNSVTVVEAQMDFEAEENPGDEHEKDGGYGGVGELRFLGRKRNYMPALPVKLPSVGPPPTSPPVPELKKLPSPPSPTKIVQPKRPVQPPKKLSTFENAPPPTKAYKIHKMPPPLKVVRAKKVVPPPKKYVIPKKVLYPKKKLHPKVVYTKYVPARKKYAPMATYVPAPTKFVPAPVYVPAPKKL